MPIIATELTYQYTGADVHAAVQVDPDLSLGNHRSSSEVPAATANNLFDDVSGDEANVGMTDYRVVGFLNSNATLSLTTTRIWISVDTGNSEDNVTFDVEAPSDSIIGYIQAIISENTSPVGLSGWSNATTKATGKDCPLSNGNVGPGEWFGIWCRRSISPFAEAKVDESFTIRVEGDTEP